MITWAHAPNGDSTTGELVWEQLEQYAQFCSPTGQPLSPPKPIKKFFKSNEAKKPLPSAERLAHLDPTFIGIIGACLVTRLAAKYANRAFGRGTQAIDVVHAVKDAIKTMESQ
jgi:hypothetical protein